MSDAQAVESDVLVIGGGPAGTTAATLLAAKGWSVTVVEKDRHPRFHIGESLLPRNVAIFRELGVMDELEKIGVLKRGADFSAPDSNRHILFDFSQAKAPDEPTAFQVKRAEFDLMLLRNAEKRGVRVLEGTTVKTVAFENGGVQATATDDAGGAHAFSARFLVDASGRDTFMSGRLGIKGRNPNHNSAAVFGHFRNVVRRDDQEEGNISIYWFPHGWFWMIPLQNGIMSVGMVVWPKFLKTRKGSLEEFFRDGLPLCPPVAERMKNAEQVADIQATGNFSYTSGHMYGDRYVMVGDAFAFIDPVFSSGVYLAMQGATFAAEAVDGALREPQRAPQHLAAFEKKVRRGLKTFSWFIYRFTSPAMQYLFRHPSRRLGMQAAVLSVLSGDVYGRTSLWKELTVFKAIYYVTTLLKWRESSEYRRRLEGAP